MYSSSLIHMHSPCIEMTPIRCATLSSRTTSKCNTLQNSSFRGGKARRELVIQMAATKEKKNADLVRLTDLLNAQETMVVAAVNYKGLSVRNAFLRFHVTRFFRPSRIRNLQQMRKLLTFYILGEEYDQIPTRTSRWRHANDS